MENQIVLTIRRRMLDTGGYDENGMYFGIGDPLFYISSEDGEVDDMIRAKNIEIARRDVRAKHPDAKIAGDNYDVSLDDDTLQAFLDMEIESSEVTDSIEIDDEIRNAARTYEAAVLQTLEGWICCNLDKIDIDGNGFEPDDDGFITPSIVREMSHLRGGAGYLYFMEAEGAGVGTWDGDWDSLFKDKSTIRELSKFVKEKTSKEYIELKRVLSDRVYVGESDEKKEIDE